MVDNGRCVADKSGVTNSPRISTVTSVLCGKTFGFLGFCARQFRYGEHSRPSSYWTRCHKKIGGVKCWHIFYVSILATNLTCESRRTVNKAEATFVALLLVLDSFTGSFQVSGVLEELK